MGSLIKTDGLWNFFLSLSFVSFTETDIEVELLKSFQQVPMQPLDWAGSQGISEAHKNWALSRNTPPTSFLCTVYVAWSQLINFVPIDFNCKWVHRRWLLWPEGSLDPPESGCCAFSQRCSMSGDIRAVSSWPLLELYMEKEAQCDLVYFSLSLNFAHIKHATDIYTINAYTNCMLVCACTRMCACVCSPVNGGTEGIETSRWNISRV